MIIAEKLITPVSDQTARTAYGSVVLEGISWRFYQALRWETPNDRLPMIYDNGRLEIMSPKREHGRVAFLLGQMIGQWTLLRGINIEPGGNMTCDREDSEKGLEPDLCFWIKHEAEIRDKDEVDLLVDPPPDLAIEVDISRSSIPKLPIYEALKIPEVWRWQRNRLEVLHLNANGSYVLSPASIELLGFPLALAERIIVQKKKSFSAIMIQFVAEASKTE